MNLLDPTIPFESKRAYMKNFTEADRNFILGFMFAIIKIREGSPVTARLLTMQYDTAEKILALRTKH